jgi:hypothetical protein
MRRLYTLAVLLCLAATASAALSLGRIAGVVRDGVTQRPLSNVTVRVVGSAKATRTAADGSYVLDSIPVGTVSVSARMVGYATATETDVVVRSERVSTVNLLLVQQASQAFPVEVVAATSGTSGGAAISAVRLNNEEIRRTPSGVGDVQRVLTAIPAVTGSEDQVNDISIRGGAPAEVGFYIDGIFTPNINHMPQQSGSGGLVSILNLRLVDHLTIMTGGFDATYGERASGIVDVALREGSRDQLHAQADFNMAGLGGYMEGPIGKNVSFVVGARHSWVDALVALLDVGKAPNYGDAQAKLVWRLNGNHRLSALGVFGLSAFERSSAQALADSLPRYGSENYAVGTYGITWQALWADNVVTNTAVGLATLRADELWQATATNVLDEQIASFDYTASIRSVTSLSLGGAGNHADLGFELRQRRLQVNEEHLGTNRTATSNVLAAFANVTGNVGTLSLTGGVRVAALQSVQDVAVDLRLQAQWMVADEVSVVAMAGQYSQELPPALLAYADGSSTLAPPRMLYLGSAVEWRPLPTTSIRLEAYQKRYHDAPSSGQRPTAFVLDDVFGTNGRWRDVDVLGHDAQARAHGVEMVVHRRLTDGWHALIGAAISATEYRDVAGLWRPRTFNNRVVATAMLGWMPAETWMVTARWSYLGGQARTPVDVTASQAAGQTVRDVVNTNGTYLPPYHGLSVRADKRWFLQSSTVTTYLMVLNAYNRRNVRDVVWSPSVPAVTNEEMWGIIPVFGVEVEI